MEKIKRIIMQLVAFGIILGISSQSIGQEKVDRNELIRKFYKDIYDVNIKAEEITSKYIKFSVSNSYNGYKDAVNTIEGFRYPSDDKQDHFSLLKNDVIKNDFSITHYDSFDDVDKAKFNSLKVSIKDGIYKLTPKHTIPAYILLDGDKVVSFFGFKKAGDDSYTFIVY